MSDRIREDHLRRAAYVYVRQSSLHQVRHHRESRQRQYDLTGRARELGFARVVVIDEDQGKSGSGLQARPGFGRLLAAVCEGEVGAVLALEASRGLLGDSLTVGDEPGAAPAGDDLGLEPAQGGGPRPGALRPSVAGVSPRRHASG